MASQRGGDRRYVAGDARDQRGARDLVTIELRRPPIRELLGGAGRLPRERLDRGVGGSRRIDAGKAAPERGEEWSREKMTVDVVEHD